MKKKLPWTYWPIIFVSVVFVILVSGVVGSYFMNPYAAGFIGAGIFTLWETYSLKRDGY